MNYAKLDAALSAALGETPVTEDDPRFVVSVRMVEPPDPAQQRALLQFGIEGVSGDDRVFSARLSARALSELSEMPSVRLVSLAQLLRPLE